MPKRTRDGDTADLARLLPFYVNGSLSPAQRRAIERALAADPDLRAELALVRRLRALVAGPGGRRGFEP